VVVVQGSDLYLYDLKTGKELTKRKLPRASSAGVAVVGDIAFSSSLPGQLVALDLTQTDNLNPWTFQLYGRVLEAPAASSSNQLAAFAADDGTVTVFSTANPDKIEPWFHFSAREPMSGPVTFCGDGLYCGDTSGQIAKIGLGRLGSIEWRFIIGDSMGAQPLLINKTLYATSEIGNLFAINDTNGSIVWPEPAPRVKSLIAAAGDHLYCRSLTDRLLCIDIQSGKIIAQSGSGLITANFTNQVNDRLYLVGSNGRLTCLRRAGKEHTLPTFYEAMPVPTEDASSAKNPGQPAAGAPAGQPSAEPADSSADPFGTGVNNAAPMNNAPASQPDPADPFAPAAGNANPF
jgi:outer membrane protein assembly factor BamB